MRSMLFAMLALGCGGSSTRPPDGTAATTLTLTVSRASGPIDTQLVAMQDGDDAWTAVSGTGGVYTSPLHGDRYGVMIACVTATYSSVYIHHGAVSDGVTLYMYDCADPGPSAATIHGTITGAAPADVVRVADDANSSVEVPAGATSYTLQTLAGADTVVAADLVAMRPVKVAMVDANVVDGATINLDLATGFVPVTRALGSTTALGGAFLSYRDIHGVTRIDRVAAPFTTYRGIPADRLGDGFNRLLAAPATNATTSTSEVVIRYFKEPVDQTITFPPALQLAPPAAIATPYPMATFALPIDAHATLYDVGFSTTDAATSAYRGWISEMTPAWVAKTYPGATTTFPYQAPDFHSLPGWRAELELMTAHPIDWDVNRVNAIDMDPYITVPPPQLPLRDGSEEQISSATGQLAAP